MDKVGVGRADSGGGDEEDRCSRDHCLILVYICIKLFKRNYELSCCQDQRKLKILTLKIQPMRIEEIGREAKSNLFPVCIKLFIDIEYIS